MAHIDNDLRDSIIHAFRERICEKMDIVPFPHQRSWWCASEGLELEKGVIAEGDQPGRWVQLADGNREKWLVKPRPLGRARFLADLGAFKIGKSFSSALWTAGFAAVPNARVALVGSEYDICAPEFDYLCDFLLSERGMGMKFDSLQNRPRDGKMWLDLPNGARFEARSWERKDSLKGKENDCYLFCEAYQLPGIECFTSNSQNLRARRGYAVFATTPDRPWIKQLHDLGHGFDAEWHCTCGVGADVNPFTFDATAKRRDETLMTREKFQIHYEGQLGDFVGHVYNYQRGQVTFGIGTHPELFEPGSQGRAEDLRIPEGWEIVSGVDTGTFYTAATVAFSPGGDAFVVAEFPNYRYVAGSPERDEDVTIPTWASRVANTVVALGGRPNFYADKNSQFKRELLAYGVNLLPSPLPLETRTEIAREYFQHGRVFLAPWLSILPFEIENAAWPEEATAAGKFARVKDRDHTLDCLEHVLSRRPRGTRPASPAVYGRWIDRFAAENGGKAPVSADPHLGRY